MAMLLLLMMMDGSGSAIATASVRDDDCGRSGESDSFSHQCVQHAVSQASHVSDLASNYQVSPNCH